MQALAQWLLARQHNAILALAVLLLLPAPQITSGAVMVLLVLARGMRLAVIGSLGAAALAAVPLLYLGGSIESIFGLMAGTWVPVVLLALVLVTLRSLTLVIQVSVIVAVAALLLFQIVVPDPAAFWQPYLDAMEVIVKESGLQLDTSLLNAEVMTISAVLVFWTLYSTALIFGYSLYKRLPVETANYGRFRDFDFGRVIAFTLAIVSLLAFATDASWLQSVAFILFVMFMMQGLAIVHWLRGEGILPVIAVVAVYALLPFLQVLLVFVLALVGYTDAWLGFRRRFEKRKGSKT